MTSALVFNNSVESFYFGDVPTRIFFAHGGTVDGADVGYSNENGYSILPASFADTPPDPRSHPTGSTYTIANGAVSVTRTWVTPAPQVPQSVDNAKARYVLMQTPSLKNSGKTLFDDVNSALMALGGVDFMAWEYSSSVGRDSSLVASMSAALGLKPDQVDALFITASAVSF